MLQIPTHAAAAAAAAVMVLLDRVTTLLNTTLLPTAAAAVAHFEVAAVGTAVCGQGSDVTACVGGLQVNRSCRFGFPACTQASRTPVMEYVCS
jgi:hypothetical protein